MAEQQFSDTQKQQIEQEILTSKIALNLTVRDVNIIISLLSKYPFEEVNQLIGELQTAGQPQVRKLLAEVEAKVAAASTAPTDVEVVK